jgi:hypothetical protein
MQKRTEVIILAGLCVCSAVLGWAIGKGAHNLGVALFFYLISAFFFLAMFRPRSL